MKSLVLTNDGMTVNNTEFESLGTTMMEKAKNEDGDSTGRHSVTSLKKHPDLVKVAPGPPPALKHVFVNHLPHMTGGVKNLQLEYRSLSPV
jgi:hypothetical protein